MNLTLKHQKQIIMKQFILLLTLCIIPFLMNAQQGNVTNGGTIQSYGLGAGTAGGNSSFFGYQAGKVNTGASNSFMGSQAGLNNTSGKFNAFYGSVAGYNNTTGSENTFIGNLTGYSNNTGNQNTFIGRGAGYFNTVGTKNLFLGYLAGFYETGSDKLIIETNTSFNNRYSPLIYGDFVENYVGIAINTDPANSDIVNPDMYGLYVGKGILTEKVKVANINSGDWSDYVFEADYDLNSTEEVETFIKENKHLPNVPSAKEVGKNGVEMVEMDATLLRQIEELWLHVIELKKENEALKTEITELKQ